MKLRKIPRGTFWFGGFSAVALAIPLMALGIYGLSTYLHWGALPTGKSGLDHIFTISLIFAGVPALVIGGGVARLAAHRLAEKPEIGLGGAVKQGGVAMAVAGIGIALLCVVPLGALPEHPRDWWPAGVVGLAVGAVCGMAVATLAGMRQKRFLHEAR